ncbi:MAG TPA: hypothetical protein VGT98_08355, partial [Candidatus Elarobacter sp.]|nr:hypothetical protein [Candidatus Elarobacter sp.]
MVPMVPMVAPLTTLTSANAARAQGGSALPASALAVRSASGAWAPVWRSDSAPTVWRDARLARAISWRAGQRGVRWGEIDLAGSGEAWRTRLVVVRVNPADVTLALDTAFTVSGDPTWTVDHAPRDVIAAVNAGQFEATMPWGWVVVGGREWLSPQSGPLSAALAQDAVGALHWVQGADVARFRASAGTTIHWAFQSYPVLLAADTVPAALRSVGRGVDLAHRDARAGICLDHDGRMLIAITRFNGVGSSLGFIPFGLTTPEMAG